MLICMHHSNFPDLNFILIDLKYFWEVATQIGGNFEETN